MKFYIETFGCQMNVHDSETLAGTLKAAGHESCSSVGQADLILLNTCSVREKAEMKVLSRVGRIRQIKQNDSGFLLGICGCMAVNKGEELFKRIPSLNLVVGPGGIERMPEHLKDARKGKKVIDLESAGRSFFDGPVPSTRPRKFQAYVTIMEGCDNFCSYCIVPYVRGREKSRRSEAVIAEVEKLAGEGCREIILLGQNVNSYRGGTKENVDFPELLERVHEVDKIERIRFITSHPKDFSEKLAAQFGKLKKLCPQLHMPAQSGSDSILKKMNRGYSGNDYIRKIDILKNYCPHIALSGDIIVGFPGETAEDFEDTMKLLRYVRYDMLYAFKYNTRPGTAAAALEDDVPEEVKSARLTEVLKLQSEIILERNAAMEGKTLEILVEGISRKGGQLTGRSPGNHVVNFKGDQELIGQVVKVKITKGAPHCLEGELP